KVVPDGQEPTPGRATRDGKDGRIEELVPMPRTIGSATIAELQSMEYIGGPTNGLQRATGQVIRFDSEDPATNARASDWARYVVLDSCGQGHFAMNEAAAPSGRSRRQARAPFEADVKTAAGSTEGGLRYIIESAVAAAEYFAGTPGKFTERLRATVDLHIDTGPPDPEDVRLDTERVEKGMMSLETALSRAGVEDVVGEVARIQARPEVRVAFTEKLAGIFGQLVAAAPEADPVELAIMAGFDEATAKRHLGAVMVARQQKAAETARIAAARTRVDAEGDELPEAA
ncbi:MAG TPA: hypothetical protein VFR37_10765, partial [Longimicrobium sp.]|nr:hypothetical protein [Longimicrobium sp.]